MRVKRKDGQETRANLLQAAAKVFAAKGFRAATITEICKLAGANVASVNYYFDSKEELYVRAWHESFADSIEKYPADGGVPADAPIEERLRGHIRAVAARCADPESVDFDIAHQEMASPTGLLADIMHESIQPLREATVRLVRELMGEKASELQVELCHMSIISQCVGPFNRKRGWRGVGKELTPCEEIVRNIDVEDFAEHVFQFSLAGMRHFLSGSEEKEGRS